MKNIVIGWMFLLAGGALLGVSLWVMRERATERASTGEHREATNTRVASTAGSVVDVPPANPAADMPADPVAGPGPVEPADMPADPGPAMEPDVGPEADMPNDTQPGPGSKEVLLVFDARSQHISQPIKDELVSLVKSNPKGSFRIEISVGDFGTQEENEKSGKRRARAIRKVLEDAGIPERKVSYKLVLPGPADGEGDKTSRQWRKATVKSVRAGE